MRAEEFVGLLHQSPVRLELLRFYRQQLGPVGKQVKMYRHLGASLQLEPCSIPARVQWTIDESLEADRLELRARPARGGGFQGGGKFPVGRQCDARLHRDPSHEISG